jgi:hypothetical protein
MAMPHPEVMNTAASSWRTPTKPFLSRCCPSASIIGLTLSPTIPQT